MPPAIEALRAAHDRGTPTLPVFREDFEDTGFGLVSRTYIAAACNAAPELLAELDKAQRSAAHWHECFQALERAIVGETGASAIHEAGRMRAELDRLKAEREALRAQSSGAAKLAAFGAWCAQEFRRELADVDGGSAQDAMERLGLLKRIEVTEPCGEGCVCAEVGFPADCYVFDDDVKAALKDTTA